MKMVKSLLLGSATGLVAIAGAQAADLPVKAKPVEYVKICSLYGAGFYYMPGSDICLKIGGWVRQQTLYGDGGNATNGALVMSNPEGINTRATSDFSWRSRGYITADARQQTAFGTARAYIAVGLSGDNGVAFSANRAFMQWAGFTFGLASSFYDFYSGPAVSYYGGRIVPSEDTGDGGNEVWAYTAQLGNGLSATIAAEDAIANRNGNIWGVGFSSAPTPIAAPGNAQAGTQVPDLVANLRVEQAWGAAQIMGAIDRVAGQYNAGATLAGGATHPDDKLGFAVGAGIKLNAPMFGQGDYFQAEVNYTQGVLGYVVAGPKVLYAAYGPGGSYGFGIPLDAVYSSTSGLQLTTAWGVNASYQHQWNSQWKTSVYGMYMSFDYNQTANSIMCTAGISGVSGLSGGLAGCDMDWSYWAVGTRTQWNVTKAFYMGVDVVYTKLQSALAGQTATFTAQGTQPAGVHSITDQDAFIGYFRVHYDFLP
jgi:Porin subfamily